MEDKDCQMIHKAGMKTQVVSSIHEGKSQISIYLASSYSDIDHFKLVIVNGAITEVSRSEFYCRPKY